MSEFNQALEYLHDSLLQLRGQGKEGLTASRQALEELLAAKEARQGTERMQGTKATEGGAASESLRGGGVGKAERMAALRSKALGCLKCAHLAAARIHVVFGAGNLDAEIMFVGAAPGVEEDEQGAPFVGKAGQLLTKIITAMGLSREAVYLANVLKCQLDVPDSGNREPSAEEMAACLPYLVEQIQIVQPKVLVALGESASKGLIQATKPMSQLRGRWHEFHGIPLMATDHPAYLLENQSNSEKRKLWEDMLLVLEKLEKPISAKQRKFFQ